MSDSMEDNQTRLLNMSDTSLAKLRRQMLQRKGVTPAKHTRKLLTFEEQPDPYPKTSKMRYIELRYHLRLEDIIFKGSLQQVCARIGYSVNRSTILRWRRYITIHRCITYD